MGVFYVSPPLVESVAAKGHSCVSAGWKVCPYESEHGYVALTWEHEHKCVHA